MNAPLHRRCFVRLTACALLGPAAARAADFPDKPLTMIVPYPAGGPADVTARQLEPALRKALGQVLVVENIAGASGSLGINRLLAAPANGYTLLLGTSSDVILGPLTLASVRYKTEQLRLLGVAGRSPLILVGRPQLEPRTLDELLAHVRSRGASYGSIGPGSLYHLVGEDLAARWKLPMTHVPYKGVAPLVQDLMGGHVDLAFLPPSGNVGSMVAQGKLQAYAVADTQRYERLPQLPTFAEAAGLQDFVYEIWGGVFISRDVPPELAQRLNTALSAALKDADFQRQMAASGSLPGTPISLDEADRLFAQQAARLRRTAQAIKLQPQ